MGDHTRHSEVGPKPLSVGMDDHVRGLKEALQYSGGTHTLGDVLQRVTEDHAQLWETENAAIVTEVYDYPRQRVVHFWLATGELHAVIELSNHVLEWAKRIGCERATLAGRRGWVRALADEGWEPMLTLMGREV